MNSVQLATVTLNGKTVYQWACARAADQVAAEAGAVCDALTDRFGDGFGWNVRPLPYAHATASAAILADAAATAIIAGGVTLNQAPTAAVVLTPHQAELCSGALEIGVDEDWSDPDEAAARELWQKVQQAAELGGSVVLTIREGEMR
jgi:hypothetical protein